MRISSLAAFLWMLLLCSFAPPFMWVIGGICIIICIVFIIWKQEWMGALKDKYDREGPGYDDLDKLDAWYADYKKKHPIATFFYNLGTDKYFRI